MVTWIEGLSAWDRSLPTVMIARRSPSQERHALARAFVAVALDLPTDRIVLDTTEGQAPRLLQPPGSGLCLSMTSRGPLMAIALAASPVGVDVEMAEPAGAIPWNVLHPREAAVLARDAEIGRVSSFARLWSLKEAYLKALGVGLSREPTSFAVRFEGAEAAAVDDPCSPHTSACVRTVWREVDGAKLAISVVVIEAATAGQSAAAKT